MNQRQRAAAMLECERLQQTLACRVRVAADSEHRAYLPLTAGIRVALRADGSHGDRPLGHIYVSDSGQLLSRIPDEDAKRVVGAPASAVIAPDLPASDIMSRRDVPTMTQSELSTLLAELAERLLFEAPERCYGPIANALESLAVNDARALSALVELRIRRGEHDSVHPVLQAAARQFIDHGDRAGVATVLRLATGRFDDHSWFREIQALASGWDCEYPDLRAVPALTVLRPDLVVDAERQFPPIACEQGVSLASKGEGVVDLFVVRRGHLCVHLDEPTADPNRIRFPGDILGERAVLVAWRRAQGLHGDVPDLERGAWVTAGPRTEIWRLPVSTVVPWLEIAEFREHLERLDVERALDNYFLFSDWLRQLVGAPTQSLRDALIVATGPEQRISVGEIVVPFRQSLGAKLLLVVSGGLTETTYDVRETKNYEPGAAWGLDELRLGSPENLAREVRANQDTTILPVTVSPSILRDLYLSWS